MFVFWSKCVLVWEIHDDRLIAMFARVCTCFVCDSTGVSKFATMSMFSGANQYQHLLEGQVEFCSLFGFTEAEIRSTYGSFIEKKYGPLEETMASLRDWYNGYRCHPEQSDAAMVYNPWSVLRFLESGKFQPYWSYTAVSKSVVGLLGLHAADVLQGFSMKSKFLLVPTRVSEWRTSWKHVAFQVR